MAKQKPQQGVHTRGKNWTTAETLKLVEAWRLELETPAKKGESTSLLNGRIYERFKGLCGGTQRSEKAVIDKKNNLPIAFKFIIVFNSNRVIGSTGQPSWFELPSDQRKLVKAANKTDVGNDMDIAVFNALKGILGGDDSVEPSAIIASVPIFERDDLTVLAEPFYMDITGAASIDVNSDALATSDSALNQQIPSSPVPSRSSSSNDTEQPSSADPHNGDKTTSELASTITGQKKRKKSFQPTNDQRFLMNLAELQTNAFVKKLNEIQEERREAQRLRLMERKETREYQERERKRDRELLRELFEYRD